MAYNDQHTTERKPYSPPKLIAYGHVKDIVQGGGGMMMEPAGNATRSCWIAEALYGIDDPRTLIVRAWVTRVYQRKERGWVLAALYARYGRRVANAIHRGYLPAAWLRPLFDRLFDKAFGDSVRTLVRADVSADQRL